MFAAVAVVAATPLERINDGGIHFSTSALQINTILLDWIGLDWTVLGTEYIKRYIYISKTRSTLRRHPQSHH